MKKIKRFIKKMVPKKYHRIISDAYNYLRSLYFFGLKYECIFCKGHFRRLLSTGLKNDIALSFIGGNFVIFYTLNVIHQIGKHWFIGIYLIK